LNFFTAGFTVWVATSSCDPDSILPVRKSELLSNYTSIETRIERYQAWIRMQPTARPLVGILWEADIPPLNEMLENIGFGNKITPEDVDPEIFLPILEHWYQQERLIDSDLIQAFTPAFGIPWVEAIAGCTLTAHPGSIWAEKTFSAYQDRPSYHFDPENPWLRKMVEFTQAMVTFSNNRFPIALPQMRGPLDTLAALRTPEQLCLDIIDQPQAVQQVLEEMTDLWINIADEVLKQIPPFHGGYLTRMKMWAPGYAITPQNDISTLFSPRIYKKHLAHLDHRIFSAFPFSSFHMHSTEHHQIENLLAQEHLTAVQFTLEHNTGGPPLDQMLAVSKRILEEKPLLLVAPDFESAEIAIQTLPTAGLCVMVWFNELEIPPVYAEWVQKYINKAFF